MIDQLNNLKTLLEAAFSTAFKLYTIAPSEFDGVPDKSMPALVISPITTGVSNEGSGTEKDRVVWRARITIVDDAKNYMKNNATQWGNSALLAQHMDWVEDRTSNDIDADTIIGVLRKNLSLTSSALYNDLVEVRWAEAPSDGTVYKTTIEFSAVHRTRRPEQT